MVIAMPASKSPEPQPLSGGDSSANEGGGEERSPLAGGADDDGDDTRKKKKGKRSSGLSLRALKSPFKFLGKTYCKGCKKKCSGEVLRVNDVYFHGECFCCKACRANLSQGGFFARDSGDYYCASCYQSNFGTKCCQCGKFVEGEVVTALGKTYHQDCFRCAGCQKPFPTGERVTYTGRTCLCQSCSAAAATTTTTASNASPTALTPPPGKISSVATGRRSASPKRGLQGPRDGSSRPRGGGKCAGCGAEFRDEGQALTALDKHYHVWCFKCRACGALLHGEYMGKDGEPYCEKDYQALFGVKCTYCFRFISGKVLQAGDNNHFHPTCARCTKCGEPFGDGEEMFLQGAAIWHPRCGPSPEEGCRRSGMAVVNGGSGSRPRPMAREFDDDRASVATAGAATPYSRASSPGGSYLHHHSRRGDSLRWRSASQMAGDYAHHANFTPSLYNSSSTYSLRRPLEPGDRTCRGSNSHLQHFHLPPSRRSSVYSSRYSTRASTDAIGPQPLGGCYRPVSAPPKPGYTLQSNAGYGGDTISQHSCSGRSTAADFSSDFMRQSNTYTHGFRSASGLRNPPRSGPAVMTEHKTYPVHLLQTSNYKLPPDVNRCSLEKHLTDGDFQMAFSMTRDEFYALPLWRRNDFKRRVRLF